MSDFEEFARSQGFSGDFQRGCNGQYKSDLLHFMEKAFMHQQAEIDRLSSVLDERTKEWLQAIECGTYFENVAKPLKEENDSLRVQLSLQRDRNKALEAELTSSRNYGDDLHCQLNNMEACYIEKKKQVEECAALAAGWNEIAWDKTTHWTEGYEEGCYHCSAQIEEALRGGS